MKGTAKQSVMVAIIVVCLILAIIITIKTRPDTSTGIPKEFAGQMMWLKCTDANCGAEYQTDKKSYYEYMEENSIGTGDMLWPIRVALSGKDRSPGPFEIMGAMGKERTVERIGKGIGKLL